MTRTVAEILDALKLYRGRFARGAVEAAVERREEMVPELLRILDEGLEQPETLRDPDFMAHLYALYRSVTLAGAVRSSGAEGGPQRPLPLRLRQEVQEVLPGHRAGGRIGGRTSPWRSVVSLSPRESIWTSAHHPL